MKKIYFLLIAFIAVSCQKENPVEPTTVSYLPAAIITNSNPQSRVELTYNANNLTAYTPTTGDEMLFTYNSLGQLATVKKGAATYELTYTNNVLTRTDKKTLQGGATLTQEYYTYVRDQKSPFIVLAIQSHNPENGSVTATHTGLYVEKEIAGGIEYSGILQGISSPTLNTSYTWNLSRPRSISPFQLWIFPDYPVCLLELPSLSKAVINGNTFNYSYEY